MKNVQWSFLLSRFMFAAFTLMFIYNVCMKLRYEISVHEMPRVRTAGRQVREYHDVTDRKRTKRGAVRTQGKGSFPRALRDALNTAKVIHTRIHTNTEFNCDVVPPPRLRLNYIVHD